MLLNIPEYNMSHKMDIINENRIMHFILCEFANRTIGYINFFEYKNVDKYFFMPDEGENKDIAHILYFQKIFIEPDYRNKKISYELYKYFNYIYEEKFKNIPIYRNFANPIAEYVVRKLVKKELINRNSFNEEFIDRGYEVKDYQLLTSLLNKLS